MGFLGGDMKKFAILVAYAVAILALFILGVAGMIPAMWLAITKSVVEFIGRVMDKIEALSSTDG